MGMCSGQAEGPAGENKQGREWRAGGVCAGIAGADGLAAAVEIRCRQARPGAGCRRTLWPGLLYGESLALAQPLLPKRRQPAAFLGGGSSGGGIWAQRAQ